MKRFERSLKGNHILEQLFKWLRVPSNGIWLNWIGLFLRESHTFLIKGFFEWKFAHFTRTWIARWIFTHFCSHHEAHGITKGLPACFFKMDTTSQLIGGSFALRSSLLLSHSHQEDTFEKNLLHFMPCHATPLLGWEIHFAHAVKRGRRWIEDEPNLGMRGRLRMDPGGWNPSRSDDVTHVTGVAPLTPDHELWCRSFVGLFGVSMNHRRKMTFIAGSKSALGWQSCRLQMNPLSTEFIAWLLLGIEHCL